MKRHQALIPLSHHHHHGLFLALKLKNAREAKGRWTIEDIYEDAKLFWENGGEDHFREEEEVLFPELAKYKPIEECPEVKEALIEHVKIRALFSQLINDEIAKTDLEAHMHQLGDCLNQHIRREERLIFPLIEQTIPDGTLQTVAHHFHSYEDIYTDS
ncbi:hypothetical protein GCM10011391_23700 [Pullulanibacillus camelliae]|uniref:Hemerythrin-like domain-containing protein n=1 Tax=Pullulanibacillus camelliae TaxID=1707096 RepID=A0A8J3DV57_9BACL|nr:hemerythrin domain-containing protein [Pullulanibacillus camelliae]GGE44165.1 hypothetical protein GCM10011391_23700 [Pullulanibacillus camelliae]